jgi:hypothetical protein
MLVVVGREVVVVALGAGSSDHHDIGVTLRDLLPEPLDLPHDLRPIT